MSPTIDKYEPLTGGTRAKLGFAVLAADVRKVLPVGLDANGKVQKGAANTGVIGVLVLTQPTSIGATVDVMQDGDIVECTGLTAGTRYYSDAAGVISTTNTGKPIGFTVEADRLVVRMGRA